MAMRSAANFLAKSAIQMMLDFALKSQALAVTCGLTARETSLARRPGVEVLYARGLGISRNGFQTLP